VSPYLLGPEGSIAIRLLKDEFCKGLVYRYQRGIVSTSANVSGEPSPNGFDEVSNQIKEQVDLILQNPSPKAKTQNKASKIVKLGIGGEYTLIRA
jgi:L-threonylcarbamoyladenylate synthase